MITVTSEMVSDALPVLREDAHKYSRGMCDLVVGSPLYAGAGVLAAAAANVMGAGYVRVYSCPEVAAALHVRQPSAVVREQRAYFEDVHASREGHPSAVVLGCGLDVQAPVTSHSYIKDVIASTSAPLVIDGSALAFFSTDEAWPLFLERAKESCQTVITPHWGEAARFSAPESDPDPAEWALSIAQYYGVTCVLKGPDTYIADAFMSEADEVFCMCEGSSVLAKAGTGDVLAGMLGSLLAQGVAPLYAACAATFIHARAGEIAKSTQGVCTTTEDVLSCIPAAVGSLK